MKKLVLASVIIAALMSTAFAQAPSKSETYLQQMVASLVGQVAQLRAALDDLQSKIQEDQKTIEALKTQAANKDTAKEPEKKK